MKRKLRYSIVFAAAMFAICAVVPASSFAGANVYLEGAYTMTNLFVQIFADTSGANLYSFGVKLSYDQNKLTVNPDRTDKNNVLWNIGLKQNCVDTSTAGQVIVVGGSLLDTDNPQTGLGGTRILLAEVDFTIDPPLDTTPVADPLAFFALGLEIGRESPFANFVDTEELILEDQGEVAFVSNLYKIAERGDANADGVLNVQDYLRARSYMGTTNFPLFADCNEDGLLNVQDYLCIRSKM